MNGSLYFNADVKNEQDRQKIFRNFEKIPSNAEKIKYAASKVYEIVRKNRDGTLKVDPLLREKKNNHQSKQFRMEGTQQFKERNFFKSLEMYNKSICYAERDTEDLAFSYANRSLVYFELKMYDLCLENIFLARQSGYPKRLVHKLNSRESKCMGHTYEMYCDDGTRYSSNIPLKPTLSFPPHSNVPFIANVLELHENNEFGRYIATNTDLAVGQVVAIEESFVAVVNEDLRYQRCANCLMENQLNLIPCESCVFTMYCNQSCSTKADKRFHRIECPIIDFLSNKWEDFDYIAIRACILAITSFDNLDELRKFIEDPETNQINAYILNYHDDISTSELYKAVHTLETNQGKRPTTELFDFAAITSILCKILITLTPLSAWIDTEKDKQMLMELLFRHLQIAATNRSNLEHKRFELMDGQPQFNLSVYGCATYAMSSLINHACSSNVVRISCGQQSAIIVCRPIKAGEQLFINYGIYHEISELQERQNALSYQYKFECKCNACQQNFPLCSNFKSAKNLPAVLRINDQVQMGMAKSNFAQQNLSRYANFLNEHDEHFPCLQLCAIQGFFRSCLTTVYNVPPMRMIDQNSEIESESSEEPKSSEELTELAQP